MYTLYFSPGSCSLIIHCLLEELGVPFEVKRVDFATQEHHGADYRKVNPKGKVPALATPDGVLTECMALVEYLCNRHDAEGRWLAKPGTWRRAKTLEAIATLSTELHNNLFNRFFHEDAFSSDPKVQAEVKSVAGERLLEFFRGEDAGLTREYWSGNGAPDAADLYFMVIIRWGRWLAPPATRMKNLESYFTRMTGRPAVARAFQREGIPPFGTT
jgi:glutathione S-transferase